MLFVADGPDLCNTTWTRLPRPAGGPGADTAFGSTPAFVHTLRWPGGAELQVYAGDRRAAAAAANGTAVAGGGGLGGGVGDAAAANATYVWLPLLPDGAGGFRMLYLDSWRVGDFKPAAPS